MSAPAVEEQFFGNVRSRVYHAKTCRNATCRNCTREFKTQGGGAGRGVQAGGGLRGAVTKFGMNAIRREGGR